MTPDRRQRVLQLYHQALGCDPEQRGDFIREACDGDEDVRRDVETLLAQEPPSDFLSSPTASVGDLIGRQIGPYLIESQLGAGGMGEVFRARDTTLGREVAIKVLPAVYSFDPERRSRFEREARVLATLNHPHIGAIYGLEHADGVLALILELVGGETLTQHLKSGAVGPGRGLPVAHAVAVAQQIAEALEAAHERGIVHRDLKPGNVVFTADGSVKVLDFGLAKAMADSGLEPRAGDTRAGVVMGTPAYMSPEQAKGAKVDKRADIWAFGCVLFEMLAGRPAFAGETAAETIAAVLGGEPAWEALPADTPAAVQLVLMHCLQKDLKQRMRDVGDVQLGLAGAFTSHPAPGVRFSAAPVPRLSWRRVGPAVAALVVGSLVTALVMRSVAPRPSRQVTRLSLGSNGALGLNVRGNERDLAITPNGSRVIYVGDNGRQLYVRALDELEPTSLVTGVALRNPFVSPDGHWIGFGDDRYLLKKVPISGGPAITVARIDSIVRGAAWLPDNTIVFATSTSGTGLQRVSANGGEPSPLTRPDPARNEFDHLWPELLPGGRALLYTIIARSGGPGASKVAIYDLQTGSSTELMSGASNAVYVSSGHLAYVAGGTLWAVPFDPDRRVAVGRAASMVSEMVTTGNGAGDFAVSANGTLFYGRAANYDPFGRTLNWVDRQGRQEPIPAPPHPYLQPRLSHDGTRVVTMSTRDPEDNIWVWDLSRRMLTRVTTDAALDTQPNWTPDDRWIVFGSNREGSWRDLWRQAADGTGAPERLTNLPGDRTSPHVTPDGRRLIFTQIALSGDTDLMEMVLETRHITPLVQTGSAEGDGQVSPDGRWLAYSSDRSGRSEIYVQSYRKAAGRWQVSTTGGQLHVWARDGRELFFQSPDGALMSVRVTATGSTWAAAPPEKVLEPGYWSRPSFIGRQYDASPDRQRFLVLGPPPTTPDPPELVVVQNWVEELKARLPSAP